jgi:hypothetical protein
MKRAGAVAIAMVAGWYVLAFALIHPLANAPVGDSWIYAEAVRWFRHTGEIHFAGFTAAMPAAQVIYGAAWASLAGFSPASLDMSIALLAAAAAMLMYALARRCGAREWQAMAAAGLLMCNPCYLLCSFSFMTEIPFIAALLGCHLAFAGGEGENRAPWLWISAILAVIAFAVRPFAGAAIVGTLGAVLLFDALRPERERAAVREMASMLAPFVFALLACGAIWLWLTVLRPLPWDLANHEHNFSYFFAVSAADYVRYGFLAPLLYLGIVLSPLALVRLESRDARRVMALGGGIFIVSAIAIKTGASVPSLPEMSCFGGWSNALLLRGLPTRFIWHGGWHWVMTALGSLGAAGLIVAAIEVVPRLNRSAAAVLITAAVYWAAIFPLWLFADRYFLVLVPAGALILALAPLPQKRAAQVAAFAMTAAMGLLSLGGTFAYQRGLAAVIEARNVLEHAGVPRRAIDAGYELNGEELYRFTGQDTMSTEAGIPMVTSATVDEYTIAVRPFPGTRIIGRTAWPGPFGLGHRDLYVLQRVRSKPRIHDAATHPMRKG